MPGHWEQCISRLVPPGIIRNCRRRPRLRLLREIQMLQDLSDDTPFLNERLESGDQTFTPPPASGKAGFPLTATLVLCFYDRAEANK